MRTLTLIERSLVSAGELTCSVGGSPTPCVDGSPSEFGRTIADAYSAFCDWFAEIWLG